MRARPLLILPAALAAVLLVAAVEPGPDAPPGLSRVVAAFAGRDVRVDAQLAPGLPADVLKRLASGLPTTVVWQVRLYVSREGWWDGLKDERKYAVTATYRPVGGDYAVERRLDGRLLETAVVPSREEAQRALTAIRGLPSFTMGPHVVGKTLVVKVRCLYGQELALGVVPTEAATGWLRSAVFVWKGEGTPP